MNDGFWPEAVVWSQCRRCFAGSLRCLESLAAHVVGPAELCDEKPPAQLYRLLKASATFLLLSGIRCRCKGRAAGAHILCHSKLTEEVGLCLGVA